MGMHLNDKDLQSFKRLHTESGASSPHTPEHGLDYRDALLEQRSQGTQEERSPA